MELWRGTLYAAILLLAVQTVQPREHRVPRSSLELKADVQELFRQPNGPGIKPDVNYLCLLEHCTPEIIGCLTSQECRDAALCAVGCLDEWDNDTTKEKYHVQNCSNKCSFTYQDERYDNYVACMTEHSCFSLPPIPSMCRAPQNVHPLKRLGPKDLEGVWWVVRGLNPVYDCYPCQKITIQQINATAWCFTPEYETYLVNGSLKLITNQHWVMPNSPPGTNISFVYHDLGMEHYETWWLLDKADDGSYILLYYCGNTLQWYYDGGLVMARNQTLTGADYKKIAAAYEKAAGIDATKFCHTEASPSCPQKREMYPNGTPCM